MESKVSGDRVSESKTRKSKEVRILQTRSRRERKQTTSTISNETESSGDDDAATEREWEMLRNNQNEGEIRASSHPVAQSIIKGFNILSMNMRNAETGQLMWRSDENDFDGLFDTELEAHVPPSILDCRTVSREITFRSEEQIENFRLEQKVYFEGMCLEEWFFEFGFVIPGSTNSWQQTIHAAEKNAMLPASLLNGKVTIETSFYDDDMFVSKSLIRIYYDAPGPE